MKFTIEIDCGNAAFGDYPWDEVARILKAYAERLENGHRPDRPALYDINGNRVGAAVFEQ